MLVAVAVTVLSQAGTSARAEIPLDENGRFSVYGDFTARLEYDWDSKRGNGTERDDRGRLRGRARLGFNFRQDNIKVGIRLRSGSDNNQQSAFITVYDFDDNPTGDADFNFDKWFLEYSNEQITAWIGRNSLPWWHQDQMSWDDDVVPAGLGFTWTPSLGEAGGLTVNTGFFTLPEGMTDFRGDLFSAQLVYDTTFAGIGWTLAGGYLGINADPITNLCAPGELPDISGCELELLLQGNGDRDYKLWTGNLQARIEAGGKPLTLGFDVQHNSENYSDAAPGSFTEFHKDADTGWTAMLLWGDVKEKGNWLLGYVYTREQMLSVNNSYTQDDWVRWGTATQVRASNIKGSEFRGAYALEKNMDLVLRVFFVDAIDFTEPGDISKEDGNRARLDLNYRF